MEPVSVAASLLTLLGAAGATCEFVYNFILDIQQMPDEIHSHAIKLRCLHHSISSLLNIYGENDMFRELQLDPYFEIHLRQFLEDIRFIASKIKRSSTQLDKSRTRHLRERLMWLSSDRRLRKFYSSLDDWIKIFSTVVSKTELELLMKISKQTAELQTIPTVLDPGRVACRNEIHLTDSGKRNSVVARHQIELYSNDERALSDTEDNNFEQGTRLNNTLNLYLSQQLDLVGLKVLRWAAITFGEWSADLQVGPVMARRWSDKGKTIYQILSWQKGICLNMTFRTNRLLARRIKLRITGLVQAPALNVSYKLTIGGILVYTSAAYAACHAGDWLSLRALLGNGKVRIMDTTGYGDTLLHIAARNNHYDIVSGLLREGAAVDAENDFGQTPLQLSVNRNCDYRVSSCLLSFGADLNHQDVTGHTPLHTFFNQSCRTIIELHQGDFDNTTQDSHGMTIVHYVSWSKSSLLVDILRCCRGNFTSLDTVDDMGSSALHFACRRGNLELLEYFLSKANATMTLPDSQGQTLMHYAVVSARAAQAIDMLFRHGFDTRAIDHHGRSVLHEAASAGNIAAIEKLIHLGASKDLSALDDCSRTPLQMATLCGRKEAEELLRSLCGNAQMSSISAEPLSNDGKGLGEEARTKEYLHLLLQALFGIGVLLVSLFLHSKS